MRYNSAGETIKVLTINDEETVDFGQSGTAGNIVITTLNATDMTDIISGGNFTVTNAMNATVVKVVNASAATGAVNVNAGGSVVAITATGNAALVVYLPSLVVQGPTPSQVACQVTT